MLKGICMVCECVVPIQHSSIARQKERIRGFNDDEINAMHGECIDYIVLPHHDDYDTQCAGTNDPPYEIIN